MSCRCKLASICLWDLYPTLIYLLLMYCVNSTAPVVSTSWGRGKRRPGFPLPQYTTAGTPRALDHQSMQYPAQPNMYIIILASRLLTSYAKWYATLLCLSIACGAIAPTDQVWQPIANQMRRHICIQQITCSEVSCRKIQGTSCVCTFLLLPHISVFLVPYMRGYEDIAVRAK